MEHVWKAQQVVDLVGQLEAPVAITTSRRTGARSSASTTSGAGLASGEQDRVVAISAIIAGSRMLSADSPRNTSAPAMTSAEVRSSI